MSSKRLEIVLSANAAAAVAACQNTTSRLEEVGRAADKAQRGLSAVGSTAAAGIAPAATAVERVDSRVIAVGRDMAVAGAAAATASSKWQGFAARGKAAMSALGAGVATVTSKVVSMGLAFAKYLALAATAAATAAGAAVIKLGAEMQQTRLTLQTMLGDVQKGNTILKQFASFANATPFSNREVIKAGKTLLAYGVSASEVLATLKAVGDIAAGTGKGLEELAATYGKIIAKGKADTMALNQLAAAGVPIVRALATQYGVAAQEVYAYAEQGKISAADVQKAFRAMTSGTGVYADMMGKQAETVAGKWSTLIGKLQNTAAVVGEALIPLVEYLLDRVMALADTIGAMADRGELTEYLLNACAVGGEGFEELLVGAIGFFGYITNGATMIYQGVRTLLGFAWLGVSAIATGITGLIESIVDSILSVYNWVMEKLGKKGVRFDRYGWTRFTWDIAELTKDEIDYSINQVGKGYEGWQRTGRVQDSVRAGFAPIKEGLMAAIDRARTEDNERRNAPDTVDGYAVVAAGQASAPTVGGAAGGDDKMQFDNLAKIGLYNHTPAPLDEERNRLLKNILTAIWEINPAPQIVEA